MDEHPGRRATALTRWALERLSEAPFVPLDLSGGYMPGVYAVVALHARWPYRRAVETGHPLYVGKSDRRVGDRLRRHGRSLGEGDGLDAAGFGAIVIDRLHPSEVAGIEAHLLWALRPAWNQERFSGFGSQARGAKRTGTAASAWDRMHPGRVSGAAPHADHRLRAEVAAFCDRYAVGVDETRYRLRWWSDQLRG